MRPEKSILFYELHPTSSSDTETYKKRKLQFLDKSSAKALQYKKNSDKEVPYMAYSELIKSFDRIRDYMRQFYIYCAPVHCFRSTKTKKD